MLEARFRTLYQLEGGGNTLTSHALHRCLLLLFKLQPHNLRDTDGEGGDQPRSCGYDRRDLCDPPSQLACEASSISLKHILLDFPVRLVVQPLDLLLKSFQLQASTGDALVLPDGSLQIHCLLPPRYHQLAGVVCESLHHHIDVLEGLHLSDAALNPSDGNGRCVERETHGLHLLHNLAEVQQLAADLEPGRGERQVRATVQLLPHFLKIRAVPLKFCCHYRRQVRPNIPMTPLVQHTLHRSLVHPDRNVIAQGVDFFSHLYTARS
mmetsp:Transcript_5699/g.13848  ORF Transcript_5699/g.13848 Transcript_5699/m.13848 type:complete len:266 (-) Transcript_5699:1285-2082(-)